MCVWGRIYSHPPRVSIPSHPANRYGCPETSKGELTPMRSKSLLQIVALLAVGGLAVPVLAKPISKSITITRAAKIGKTNLSAGEYRLLIDGNKVTAQKGNKDVAESEGRWEERQEKSNADSVLVASDGTVQEVRFAGTNLALVPCS